jgi:serine/threonine protein kinase
MSPEALLDTSSREPSMDGRRRPIMKVRRHTYFWPECIRLTRSIFPSHFQLGRSSDVWSLGCILYQMVYGHTPFSHLNLIQKLQSIVDPKYEIEFLPIENPYLLDVMKKTLQRDPSARPSIPQLLQHSFLHPEKYVLRKAKPYRDPPPIYTSLSHTRKNSTLFLHRRSITRRCHRIFA